jgi:hypothetical protein
VGEVVFIEVRQCVPGELGCVFG